MGGSAVVTAVNISGSGVITLTGTNLTAVTVLSLTGTGQSSALTIGAKNAGCTVNGAAVETSCPAVNVIFGVACANTASTPGNAWACYSNSSSAQMVAFVTCLRSQVTN